METDNIAGPPCMSSTFLNQGFFPNSDLGSGDCGDTLPAPCAEAVFLRRTGTCNDGLGETLTKETLMSYLAFIL